MEAKCAAAASPHSGCFLQIAVAAAATCSFLCAVNANTYQALTDASVSLFASSATSDGVAEAMTKLLAGEALDPVETYRCRNMYVAVMRNLENWHYQWDGNADAPRRKAYADLICDLVIGGLPACAGFWLFTLWF